MNTDSQPYTRRVTPRLVKTIRETAKQFGVGELTVRRRIKAGSLNAVRLGGSWRIPAANLERLFDLPPQCTVRQVANSLDVSELTVRRWIKAGQLHATKGPRVWMVLREELEHILISGIEDGCPVAEQPDAE